MHVSLKNIAKKYGKNWVLKNVNLELNSGDSYAILGANGSGKSTLLKIISGQVQPNKGSIDYEKTSVEAIYKNISFCAPYLDLIEELTFEELLDFTEKFKPFLSEYPKEYISSLFPYDKTKWIKDYSSGMKQRVKLALALFADVDITLLDEPTSNLDEEGVLWYLDLLQKIPQNRTVIIASNEEREYSFCKHMIDIRKFKI